MHTLDLNLIEKAMGETALASHKSIHATERTGLYRRDAGGAKKVTTSVTLSRVNAELCAQRALEFANQVEVV